MKKEESVEKELINPLRNERITVKFVPKPGSITDPKHVLYGGMADDAVRTYTVPFQRNGELKNPLTNDEKNYFEELLGTDMSVYKGYWINYQVRVPKSGLILDLTKVEDYLSYKVLLANNNLIAPSVDELRRNPKSTYLFVISSDIKDVEDGISRVNVKKECYKLLGKFEDDFNTLKVIVELYSGRPISGNMKKEFLITKVDEATEDDPQKLYEIMSDPLLSTIVLIKESVTSGTIYKKGDYYYVRADNMPLCDANQDPTLKNAARFLNNPKHQELLFTLQAKLTTENK